MAEMTDEEIIAALSNVSRIIAMVAEAGRMKERIRELEDALDTRTSDIMKYNKRVRELESLLADRDAQIAELKAPKTPERRRAYMRAYMKKRRNRS